MYRQWSIAGWQPGDKLIYLGGSSLYPSLHALGKWFYIKLNNWILLSAFQMSDDNMKKWIIKIKQLNVKFMHAYASSAYLFAKFVEDQGITDISFKAVVTSAEPLYSEYRDTIERAFSTEVYDLYGAVDGGGFAYECEQHSGLHCAFENSLIEVLKEDGNLAGPGEDGEIIATDLFNYAMPFIRYRVGDIATVDSSLCKCGRESPLLKNIKGRSHDFVTTRDGRNVHGEYFAHLFRGADWISQFYVVQESETELLIYLKPEKWPSPNQIGFIENTMKRNFSGMKIDIKLTENIPTTKGGKFRYVIRSPVLLRHTK
jgi:phenylacetate-CoA ligase